MDSGTSQSGRGLGHVDGHAVDQVKDEPHSDTKLLKVKLAIIVHIRQIPHALELVISQMRVLEHRSSLRAVEMGPPVAQRAEDLPVLLHFVLLDTVWRHGGV